MTFKGMPYAAPVGGEARFMSPAKPKPWAGVRSSMQYGWVCPQVARAGWANDEEAWLFSWDNGIPGEDCLRANVWTPGINDNKKRPVMVWLHGGGFQSGSGFDILSFISTAPMRQNSVTQAELKAAQGASPAYLYLFTWRTPVLDGRPRAFHCAELAFV